MKYLAILGRQPEISTAELEALGCIVQRVTSVTPSLFVAEISTPDNLPLDINRLGGTQKLAILLSNSPLETMKSAPDGKITFGITEFSTSHRTTPEAQKLKRELVKQGRSVRIVESRTGVISTATNLHNGLSGKNPRKFEFIHFQNHWYRVIGVQDIDAYAKRDQNRPARDPKIGMLPPKLAQVLLNLAGALPPHSKILDPFCGTGVVLQEAILMGYTAYGTDINPRMVNYSLKNLKWLTEGSKLGLPGYSGSHDRGLAREPRNDGRERRDPGNPSFEPREPRRRASEKFSFEPSGSEQYTIEIGDARNTTWTPPIDAVVTEGYLGKPFSHIPTEIELKTEIQAVKPLILAFLKNLAPQIKPQTPVILATPAWLRENGQYFRLNILDEIVDLGYNVGDKTREGLLYHRSGQVVARDIIILRKK